MPLLLSGYLLVFYNIISIYVLKGAVILSNVCFNVEDATYAVVPVRQHQEVATLVKIQTSFDALESLDGL